MWRILAVSAAAILISTSALAIVTRHDLASEAYLANETDYPFLASMFTTPDGHRDCVATLIAPHWLATARHCTEDPALDELVAEGGYSITFANGRKAALAHIERMPDGDGMPLSNDIALLKLAEPVADIPTVPLYEGGDELRRVVFFPGWGGTGNGVEGLGEEDGKFRVAENRVDAVFDNFLIFHFDDPRSHLARAVALEGISGPGDSGGPALIATPQGLQLAGISSSQRTYGASEGRYGVDEYYVRISAVRQWIDEVVGRPSV